MFKAFALISLICSSVHAYALGPRASASKEPNTSRIAAGLPTATASKCFAFQGTPNTNPQSFIIPLGNSSNDDFGDPRVMLDPVSGLYYAYANYWNNQTNVPYAVSSDFRTGWTWYNYHDTFPNPAPGGWEDQGQTGNIELWDPFVQYYPAAKHYVMYYSARTNLLNTTITRIGAHCIGSAIATSPTGPFIAQPEPFICVNATDQLSHISPEIIQWNGTYFVVSKYGNGFAPGTHSEIWLAELDDTGTVINTPQRTIYTSTATDHDAEGPNIVIAPDGTFYLFYVAGYFSSPDYQIRYIPSSGGIYGPYDTESKLLLGTGYTNGVYLLSPGGPSFVSNELMMFMSTAPYTRNCTSGGYDVRGPRVAKLEYGNNNTITLAMQW